MAVAGENTTCPTCGAILAAPPRSADDSLRCPHCDSSLVVHVSAQAEPDRPRVRRIPPPLLQVGTRQNLPASPAQTSDGLTAPLPRAVADREHGDQASPFSVGSPVDDGLPDLPTIVPTDRRRKRAIRSPKLAVSPRYLRYGIFYGIWIGPVALWVAFIMLCFAVEGGRGDRGGILLAGTMTTLCFGLPWLLVAGWPAYFATHYILATFVSAVRCPGCHEVHPLVSRWGCGCGFTDYRERHLYRFRCPKCGDRIGYLNCRRCEATILL